jgi:MFS family permease
VVDVSSQARSRPPGDTPAHAPRKPSVLRHNLTLCTAEGLVAMPIVYLALPGNFIVAALLTQVFPLGRTLFGVIVSLPWWCNVVQLALMPLLMGRWSQKTIALTFSWLHLAVWIALGVVLPFMPSDDLHAAGRGFFFIFAVSALFMSMVGVAWTSWVQEWVPDRVRGMYFGRRNRLLQISTAAFLLAAGEVVARCSTVSPELGYQIVIGASVLLRSLSILAQHRILATTAERPREGRRDLRGQLRLIASNKPLLWLFAFGGAFGLTTNLFGAFFNLFMYESLGQTVADVGMLTVITNMTGALALPAWGQFLDRYGNKGVMAVALFLWMAPGYLWATITPESTWMLKLLFASGGIFQAGFVLGQFNILLKLVPAEAKTAAISLNVAVTSLAAAVAPIVGGIVLDAVLERGYERIDVYHGMAIAHHTLVILAIPALLHVIEPKASPLVKVVGAMRSYRQVLALLGLSFLVNYVFTKPPRSGLH